MKDFKSINGHVNWCRGPEIHIYDNSCEKYAVAFNQFINNQWCNIHSIFDFHKNTFFKTNYKFRIKWKIKAWKYDNSLIQVLESTYDEKNKNICLIFKNDYYEAHKSWFIKSIKLQLEEQFNLFVFSKFHDRLKKDFRNYPAVINDDLKDIATFENDNNIYATYIIDRNELLTKGGVDWHSDKIFINHTNPSRSWDHPNDWLGKSHDQIYDDIIGL